MNYQVVYESRSGNTKTVAEAVMGVLPESSTELVDINAGSPSRDADVYCIGYGVHSRICSLKLLEFIELLTDKRILLFATCGMEPTEEYRKLLERNIQPFLPDNCDYRGMFLCQGTIPEEGITMLRSHMKRTKGEDTLHQLDELIACAQTHPDRSDLDAVRQFVKTALKL